MLGWDNVFHCEINSFCREVLGYWFPASISYEDITKTDFTEWKGKIDVLSGGFPCQPFSLAGRRGGAEDDRYLWPQMFRVIQEVRPTWVVGENVAGIASMVQPGEVVRVESQASLFGTYNEDVETLRAEFVIETVCRDLERAGYSVQPVVIPACAVGAPHRRDRVFFLAHVTNAGSGRLEGGGRQCKEGKKRARRGRLSRHSSAIWQNLACCQRPRQGITSRHTTKMQCSARTRRHGTTSFPIFRQCLG